MENNENVKNDEIKKMLEMLTKEQQNLVKSITELKNEQEKLKDELKIQNIVLNSIPFRSEILN